MIDNEYTPPERERKLYLVQQFSNERPGAINGFVVATFDREEALLTNPVGLMNFSLGKGGAFIPKEPCWVPRAELVTTTYLGKANFDVQGIQLVSAFVEV